jgi:hypothetical protein
VRERLGVQILPDAKYAKIVKIATPIEWVVWLPVETSSD